MYICLDGKLQSARSQTGRRLPLPLMSMFLVTLVCFATSVHAQSDANVARYNLGVNFRFRKSIDCVNHLWHHTFVIEIPERPFEVNASFFDDGYYLSGPNLKLFCENFAPQNVTFKVNIVLLDSTTWGHCKDYLTAVQSLNKTFQHNYKMIRDAYEKMHDLLPVPYNSSGIKRGLFNFLGNWANSLFGIATQGQIDALQKSFKNMAVVVDAEISGVHKTVSDFVTMSKQLNARMDNIVELVQESGTKVLTQFQKALDQTLTRADYLESLTRKTTDMIESTMLLLQQLNQYTAAFQVLAIGKLPTFLIPRDAVLNLLQNVGGMISIENSTTNYTYRVLFTSPLDFYSNARFVYATDSQHILITVEIPLTVLSSSFQVYEIETFPHIIDELGSAVLHLKQFPPAIAISLPDDLWFPLTQSELTELLITARHTTLRRMMKRIAQPSTECIMAIFFDQIQPVRSICKYDIIVQSVQPMVQQLSDDLFLFTNVSEYSLDCANVALSRNVTHCGVQCLVMVPETCSVSFADSFITPLYSENIPQAVKHQYFVPKVLLSYFYDEDDVNRLKGDRLFDTPPNIQLPRIQVYKTDTEKFLAVDEATKLDLQRSVAALTSDRDLIQTLAHSIMIGDVQVPSVFGSWVDYLSITIAVLTCLNLGFMVFLSLKLRKVAIILATLQNLIPLTAKADDVTPWLKPLSKTVSVVMSNVTQPLPELHEFIWSHLENKWLYLIILAILLALIFTGIKWGVKKYRSKMLTSTVRTYLLLRIYGDRGSILIEIDYFFSPPSEITIQMLDIPTFVILEWGLWPKISYIWNATFRELSAEGHASKIKQKVNINWCQAKKVSHIISASYHMTPFFGHLHGTHLRFIRIALSDNTPGASGYTDSQLTVTTAL